MKLTRFDDASHYYHYQQVKKYLLEHEAANCLILGIARGLSCGEINSVSKPYLSIVENNQTILATAIQTPPRNLILAKSGNTEAVELIAKDLASNFLSLPGVIAPKAEAENFVRTWKSLTGKSSKLELAMRIHQLEQVEPINKASGNLRIATQSDRTLLTDWIRAFEQEALGDNEPESDSQLWFERHLKNKSLSVWQDKDTVTSMAACSSATVNGIRVNAVYTPPKHRGKGYATSCVAEMSQELLNRYQYCFLFTDLANPASNHMYRKIGYLPMDDVSNYIFN